MDSTFGELELNGRVQEKAGKTIAQRMTPLAGIYAILFCALLVGTLLTPKQSPLAQGFIIYVFALSLLLFATTFYAQRSDRSVARAVFYFEVLLMGASWGGLCAYMQYVSPLGWTNFIVILMTLFLSASQMASLIPNFRLLALFQGLLLVPSVFVNYYNVGGTQGYMVGSFFVGFFVVFVVLGRVQFLQFWKSAQAHERIEAIVDGMPGTLAWVNSSETFLRINQKMADLLDFKRNESHDQKFAKAPQFIHSYLENLFSKGEERVSGLVEKERKKIFMTGQKYNQGTEAIILGIDVTDQHLVQEQLEFQRAQSQSSARYAGLGEIISSLTKDLPAQCDDDLEAVKKVWPIIHRLMASQREQVAKFDLVEMVKEVRSFFEHRAEKRGVELTLLLPQEPVQVKAHAGDVLLALLNLVNNAFEVASSAENKKVEMDLAVEGNIKKISVTDYAVGVPDYLEEVIFEPNFTTKEAGGSTGLGLSLSKQLILDNGGQLKLSSPRQPTTFAIELQDA